MIDSSRGDPVSSWTPNPNPVPGWYPTPYGPRYFDGWTWLEPPPPPRNRPLPAVGWALLAAAAMIVIGSVMDWVTAANGLVSKSGVDGASDGWFTLVFGLLIAGFALPIALRRGHLGFAVTAAALGVLAGAVAVIDINDVQDHPYVSVGAGLWVVLFGALAGTVLGIVGAFAKSHG